MKIEKEKCTGAGALDHAVVDKRKGKKKRYQKSLSNRDRCVQCKVKYMIDIQRKGNITTQTPRVRKVRMRRYRCRYRCRRKTFTSPSTSNPHICETKSKKKQDRTKVVPSGPESRFSFLLSLALRQERRPERGRHRRQSSRYPPGSQQR